MRIAFWLSGVVLGTLLSTVGMADYAQNHPDSALGQWLHPPVAVDASTEADFAPPPVVGDAPEAIEELPASKPEPPAASAPPAKDDESEDEALAVIVGDPLPPPVIPPAGESAEPMILPLSVDVEVDSTAIEDVLVVFAETDAVPLPVVEVLPVMPGECDEDEATGTAAPVKVAGLEDESDECDEVVFPVATRLADAFYACIENCIADTIAFFGPEKDDAEVELESADAREAAKSGLQLCVRVEVESGRFALEIKCSANDKMTPSAKPTAEKEAKTEVENAEAPETVYYPEALPLPFGPVFPDEGMTEDAQDQEDCPPGHEQVCPYCGKWFGCDQPTTDGPAIDAGDSPAKVADSGMDDGCLDIDAIDADLPDDEIIDDLVFHVELDVL
jgi:hypothetical protein